MKAKETERSGALEPLLVDEGTAAGMLSVSAETLRKWRRSDPPKGPRFRRLGTGRLVRYSVADLEAFAGGAGRDAI